MSVLGQFTLPAIKNEPMRQYAVNSQERLDLQEAIKEMKNKLPIQVPLVIAGKEISNSGEVGKQFSPQDHKLVVCEYQKANAEQVSEAIESAIKARKAWSELTINDRFSIFMKAAHLIATKYRYKIMAATILGQGKNYWQAEIDAAAELVDFLRFNCKYAAQLYSTQPPENAPGVWNRTEYRPLEGFVYAVTPFNFTAIAGNLVAAPALLGNVVVMKPSDSAILSNYIMLEILYEAGVPKEVIQFVPGNPELVSNVCFNHKLFSALHYTGSTKVFRGLWSKIAMNVAKDDFYLSYPRIVGETGGKDFHLITKNANASNAAINSVRAAFEYQGQKCSALSRIYVSKSIWDGDFKTILINETKNLKVGPPEDCQNFVGPVIHAASFAKLKKVIDDAKQDSEVEIVAGGSYDDSKGYFVTPTLLRSTNPKHEIFTTEFFGPIVAIYVYEDSDLETVCDLIDKSTSYALTGSIFTQCRQEINELSIKLRNSAGNFYINDKCTGAVVGEQPFGGSRASGTNDKAGSAALLTRFVSPRTMKENFGYQDIVAYPSNFV